MWYDSRGNICLKPVDDCRRFFAQALWHRIGHAIDIDRAAEQMSLAQSRILDGYEQALPGDEEAGYEGIALPSWYVFQAEDDQHLGRLLLRQIDATHPRWRLDRVDLACRALDQARHALASPSRGILFAAPA